MFHARIASGNVITDAVNTGTKPMEVRMPPPLFLYGSHNSTTVYHHGKLLDGGARRIIRVTSRSDAESSVEGYVQRAMSLKKVKGTIASLPCLYHTTTAVPVRPTSIQMYVGYSM